MSSSPALSPKKDPAPQPFPYADAVDSQSGGVQAPEEMARTASVRENEIREAARREGEAQARLSYEVQLESLRVGIQNTLHEFARERQTYFQQVETEVVQLALSIARKVLHREAQVDPLLLAGIVRVALDQIESATKVTVRVNPLQAADCRAFFARNMEPQEVPEVEEDPTMAAEHCVLHTEMGSTELGVEVQFKEIEQGLMDLLAQRPQQRV